MSIKGISTLFFTLGFSILIASAAEDTFTVQTFIGSDTTPPSIPLNLAAVPVATSQIDLTWGTSTDDFLLGGYQVFRDDVQVGTTTSPSYSDVGLQPDTLYTYFVTAFDSFNNFSASSTAVATTTLTLEPTTTPPVVDDNVQGSIRFPLELISFEIIPSQYGAVVRYVTRGYVRTVVKWGTTIAYESGSSAERSFSKMHEARINDLKPGTRYQLTIQGESQRGVFGTLTETSFTTLPADDTLPPGNVMNFVATTEEDDVLLSWENPRDIDFDHVRIVRNDTFYPGDIADGWVVYEGTDTSFTDHNIFFPDARFYYTAFTYDTIGNISSGAVVSVLPQKLPTDETKNEIELTFDDLEFYQNDERVTPDSVGSIQINGGRHLTIAIPYDILPEHLKTILVTIVPQSDPTKTLSFLLKINKEKSWYTARLAPLGVAGDFSVDVTVFDFKTAQIGYAKGSFHSVISTYDRDETESGIGFLDTDIFVNTSYLVLFALLLALLALASRRLMYARW